MLHEARDRQKFVSDVQYLRDMQHKGDSEYQACLKRQEYKKDPNEKRQDQMWGKDSSDKSRFSSGSSSKQSSCEEDSLSEPRSCTKVPTGKCEPRLPAIDQTPVKQKHKSTMTPKKPEKVSPSKPPPASQAPKILSRKRRPNLGRLTVSPEMHGPRSSGERSRQKLQLSAKAPAVLGPDPTVQQESLKCANETKLKRPARERRNLATPSQLVRIAGKSLERQKKGEPSARVPNEPHTTLAQTFQPGSGPQALSEPLGPPLLPTTAVGPRRAPFRFHDEDFYSALSLTGEHEHYDTEEETHMEEEQLLVGMRSPPSQKRSRVLGTSATQSRNAEEIAESLRENSLRWSEPNPGPPRKSGPAEAAAKQRTSQDARRPGESAEEGPGGGQEDGKSPVPGDPDLDGAIRVGADDQPCDSPMEDRPAAHSAHSRERDWQNYLSGSRSSFDCLLSGRPSAPRAAVAAPFSPHGAALHSALVDDLPAGLAVAPLLGPSSDLEESLRFNVRRPLSPIRNRNPSATADSSRGDDPRGAEEAASTSQAQRAEDGATPQSGAALGDSPSSPTRRHLQGRFYMPRSLQENIPFTFFAVSDLQSQSDNGALVRVSGDKDEKGAAEIKADPEKLRKLQESLLEEDSEEEEGDLCRICQIAGGSPSNPLLEPCGCVGSLQFVHQECLKKWLKVKITSGADLGTVKTCEMCKQGLLVDLDDFNMTEFYHKHQQSRAQSELMNSGLYLVLLLHLYEQRFAELMTLNYRRASRERVPSREMVMKAAFTKAGSSSRGAGRGGQQRPLHPEALSPFPCAPLLPSSLLKPKPMCSQLPSSPVPLCLGGVWFEHPWVATGDHPSQQSPVGSPACCPSAQQPGLPLLRASVQASARPEWSGAMHSVN